MGGSQVRPPSFCTGLGPWAVQGAYVQGRVSFPSKVGLLDAPLDFPLHPQDLSTRPTFLEPLPTPQFTPFLEQERQWVEICSQSSIFFLQSSKITEAVTDRMDLEQTKLLASAIFLESLLRVRLQ